MDTRQAWWPPLPEAPGFEHVVIDTPGLRSHVAVLGEGEPILMLHGFPQHWWQWHAVAPMLAARGHRVICPDLRGAGWTAAAYPAVRRETLLADLLALLDALDIGEARLVSHDMASLTAMQLCYRHPERVRAHVQLSVPPAFMAFSPRMMPAFAHLPPLIMHREGQSLRDLFGPAYAHHRLSDEVLDAYLRPLRRAEIDRAVRALCRGLVIPEALRIVRGSYRRERLRIPTLVAFGRQDSRFAEPFVRHICRDHERFADQFELTFVYDASHFIVDDAPKAVAALIIDWFERTGHR